VRDLIRPGAGWNSALPLTILVALTACGGEGSGRQIVSETGGETLVLENGVCIEIDTTGDEDSVHRVNPASCGI